MVLSIVLGVGSARGDPVVIPTIDRLNSLIAELEAIAEGIGGKPATDMPFAANAPTETAHDDAGIVRSRKVKCFGVSEMPFESRDALDKQVKAIAEITEFGQTALDGARRAGAGGEQLSGFICDQLARMSKTVGDVDEGSLMGAVFHLDYCAAEDDAFVPAEAAARVRRLFYKFRDLRSVLPEYLTACGA